MHPWITGLFGWRQRRAREDWLALAPKLELTFTGGGKRRLLAGRHKGYEVEVLLLPDGTAQLRLKTGASLPAGLHLFRQEEGSRRLPSGEGQDIQVGAPALDQAFVIQGRNPAAVIRLLREPGVSEALLALQADNPQAVITESEVVASLTPPVQEESCRRALRSLVHVASVLERVSVEHARQVALARDQTRSEAPVERDRPRALASDKLRSEREIREAFAWRRRLFFLFAHVPLITGVLLTLVARKFISTLPGGGFFKGGLALLAVGVLGGLYGQYKLLRCPSCDENLVQRTRPGLFGPTESALPRRFRIDEALSLEACPFCKARLR